MTLLETIIAYCVDNGVVLGDGQDCFRDFMPDTPDNVVVLHEYAGDAPSQYTSILQRSVQVKVRNNDAELARAKCIQIYDLLRRTGEDLRVDFSESAWGQVYLRQTPYKLLQDGSNRVTYCFNLGITTNILD